MGTIGHQVLIEHIPDEQSCLNKNKKKHLRLFPELCILYNNKHLIHQVLRISHSDLDKSHNCIHHIFAPKCMGVHMSRR